MVTEINLVSSSTLSPTQRITVLHTLDHAGRLNVVKASSHTYFTEIYSSAPGVIGFLVPLIPFARREDVQCETGELRPGDLVVKSHIFDPGKDWVLAVESAPYGEAGRVHIILGGSEFRDVDDLVESVVAKHFACELDHSACVADNGSGFIYRLTEILRSVTGGATRGPAQADCVNKSATIVQRFSLLEGGTLPLLQLRPLVYGPRKVSHV